MDDLRRVQDADLDVFKEIGNIGAGNAATALAGILNMQINMEIPEVKIVPFDDIVNILHGPETLVVGMLVSMSGDLDGYILLILEMGDAYSISCVATGKEPNVPDDPSTIVLDEYDSSVLNEVANILVGAYLSAICSMTGLTVTPAVPQMAIDMVGAIMSIVAIEYGQIGESVLFLKTRFADLSENLMGHFFLIPDYESYKILMNSLGLS